jgi:hypothetical protein
MKHSAKRTLKVMLHVILCITMVAVFGNFCRLRTVAAQHPYKEYLSGVIVLALVYLNTLFLFPRLFKTKRTLLYLLWTSVSVVVASLLEMSLVFPDAMLVIGGQFTLPDGVLYFVEDGLCVLFRDFSVVAFSFAVMAMENYISQWNRMEIYLARELQLVETKDFKTKTNIRISIKDIAYIYQDQNYTYLNLSNGTKVFRYGTLMQMTGLLNDDSYVQITGKTVVMCNSIQRYDLSGVVVKVSPKNVLLPFSSMYQEIAMNRIFNLTGLHPYEEKTKKKPQYSASHKQKESAEKLIYNYIASHPKCKAADIKKNRSISQPTVNRILAQLKKDGLIEYVGSKKTGGYKATGNRQQKETFQETSLS